MIQAVQKFPVTKEAAVLTAQTYKGVDLSTQKEVNDTVISALSTQTLESLNDIRVDESGVVGAIDGHVLTFVNGKWEGTNLIMPEVDLSEIEEGLKDLNTDLGELQKELDSILKEPTMLHLWVDGDVLWTDLHFASMHSISTKGVGLEGEPSDGIYILHNWDDYNDSSKNYVLSAKLGKGLLDSTVENNANILKLNNWQIDVNNDLTEVKGRVSLLEDQHDLDWDKLRQLTEWFKIDNDNNVYTTFDFYSTKSISTKGIGNSSGGGASIDLLLKWPDVWNNNYQSYALGANLGWLLKEIVSDNSNAIENNTKSIGLLNNSYAKLVENDTLLQEKIDNLADVSQLLEWFKKDDDGNVYTTFNFYSTQAISTKGVGSGSSGSGGGASMLYQLYDVQANAEGNQVAGAVKGNVLTFNGKRWEGTTIEIPDVDFSEITNQIDALAAEVSKKQDRGELNETLIDYNNRINDNADNISKILKWFTLDEENEVLFTTYNLASEKSIATKGTGTSSGGGGNSYPRLDRWENYDAANGAVLSATLGYELYDKLLPVSKDFLTSLPQRLQQSEAGVDGVNVALAAINDTLATHTEDIDTNEAAIKSINDKLTPIEEAVNAIKNWFTLEDGTLITEYNLASKKSVSTKGIGSSNGGGGGVSYSRLDTWDGYTTDKAGYVLSAKLGWDLKTQLDNLDINDFDLSNYYTKENVNNLLRSKQDTINDLDAYAKTAAIQQWVIDQSYATTGQFEGITLILDAHDARILANENNIKGVDDRLKKVEAWFTLKDDVLMTEHNLASSQSIATKGVGTSSGSGGAVPWGEIENSIIPKVTDTYSIGTNTNKWKSIYAIEGHINSLVAHALSAESIKLNGKDVATKEYVIAMVAQGGGGGGTGGSSTVSYLPTIALGKEIGTLIVDGVSYGLFAPSKYSWEEIDDKPNFAKVAFSGSYNDLTDVPTFYTLTIQKNGTDVGTFTPNSKNATINIDGVVTLSDEQEITGRKTFTGGVRLDSNTVIRNAQFIGTNASDAVLWKVDNTGNATFVNGVLGGTLSVAKESTFTGETTHNGGIVIPSGKTLKIGNTVIEEKDGGLFVNGDLAASGSVATKGVGSSSGGGGNSYGRLDDWSNYDASNGDVLSALLGYGLKNDIATLTSKFGNYFTKNETRNEIVAYLNDFNDEMIIPNYSTKSEVGSLADLVGGIGTRVSTLESKATAVSFAQTLQSGKQIGVLTIDGTATTLFAPAGYAWGEITSKPTTLAGYGITDAWEFMDNTNYVACNFRNSNLSQKAAEKYIEFWDGAGGWFNFLAGKYIVSGGTSSQFLKADGSLDSTAYLPLNGGRINGTAITPLTLNTTATAEVGLLLSMSGANKGWLGYTPNIGVYMYSYGTGSGAHKLGLSDAGVGFLDSYTLIHSGNIGRQSVNYATSARHTLCFTNVIHVDNTGCDANTLIGGGGLYNYYGIGVLNNAPENMQYGRILCLTDSNYAGGINGQLAWDIFHNSTTDTTRGLWWRAIQNADRVSYAKWHQIAFTDSNVASANKLSDNTAYTVWGQTFFENGKPKNVSGNLSLGTSRLMFADSSNTNYKTMYLSDTYGLYIGDGTSSKYNTSIWGDNLQFITGTNGQVRLCIKNNGNVLIGTTTDSGYKLYVNGNSYFNGTLNASGAVTLGSTLSVEGTTRTKNVYPTEGNHNKFDIGASSNQYRYIYGGWIGSGVGESLTFGANNGYGIYINTDNNVTIGSSDLAGTTAKLYVDGSASAYYFKEKTISSRRQETGYNWYTIYSANVASQGDNVIIKLSHSYWNQKTDSVILCASIGYYCAMINQLSYSKTGSSVFKQARIRKYGDTYYVDVLLHNTEANTDMFFVTGSGKGDFVNFELVTSTDYLLITEHTLSAGAMSVGGALSVGDNITSAGAITIKDTVYGIGTTGVIRGSKLVSEGTIETSTLKVGSILIEDKDGDLFVNGNLAASGSVATKGIGTSSSGGSGTIPWSEVPMSILPANNTLYLGSNAKPWDRVFSSYFGTDNNHTIITGTSVNIVSDLYFSNGIDHIDTDGNAYLHSIYMDDELVATEAWVNTKLGAAASYGIGYVQSGNNGLVTGNSVYVALTSYDSDVLASKYATTANTYTKTQVNNNFAAKSEAEIVYSVSVTGDRNVAPSLNLDCGNGVWSLRNVFNGTNGDLKFLFDAQQKAQLTTAGDLSISGRLTQSSDETLKAIISHNVDMKVKDIANAPICYFTWKDRVSDRQIGTIAQYWKLITPECVVGEEGQMSMDYSTLGLVSSIINAREIVKHEDEIEALKRRVKELEDKLAAVSAA